MRKRKRKSVRKTSFDSRKVREQQEIAQAQAGKSWKDEARAKRKSEREKTAIDREFERALKQDALA